MVTLRHLQRAFSARAAGKPEERWLREDVMLAFSHLADRLTGYPAGGMAVGPTPEGHLTTLCDCESCRGGFPTATNVRGLVDRLAQREGANANVYDVLRKYFPREDTESPPGDGDESGQSAGNTGSPANSSSGSSGSTPGGSPDADSQPGEQPDEGDADDLESPAQPMPRTTNPAPPKPTLEQMALQQAREALKNADPSRVKTARRDMRRARKKLSAKQTAASKSAPSFQSRRTIAKATGRLQRVPGPLRNKMAGLINRLVMRGGTAGESLSPIPVTSAPKLVRRMVVRRPLPNALKEDTVAGRPAILFLPDISPSCESQAQIACDLANAAGYAGTSGSDVLVFPHSNGCVERESEYTPWLNGKPMTTETKEITKIFDSVIHGRSEFLIKVIICLGDHDAEELYRDLCTQIPKLHRLIWLHNIGDKAPRPITGGRLFPNWRAEAIDKLIMIGGCENRPKMIKGLEIAIKS